MRTIETEIRIAAPTEQVWRVLTDFAGHAQWDPFIAEIAGEARPGARLRVRFHKGMTMRPRVTEVDPGRAFEWKGKLGVGGLFDARHRFELVADGDGTRLRHTERFTGLLVGISGRLLAGTAAGFEAFNHAIKRRVEGAAA